MLLSRAGACACGIGGSGARSSSGVLFRLQPAGKFGVLGLLPVAAACIVSWNGLVLASVERRLITREW